MVEAAAEWEAAAEAEVAAPPAPTAVSTFCRLRGGVLACGADLAADLAASSALPSTERA